MSGKSVGYIYYFYCRISKKYYIGQTTRSLNIRVKEHLKHSESLSKNHFHNALRKYGIENFDIKILHVIEKENKKDLIDELNRLEILEINNFDSMKNGYNSNSGGKRYVLSEKLKKQLSESHKGIIFSDEHKKHLSDANIGNPNLIKGLKGRIVSSETRQKISESVKKSYTDEHRLKISMISKGKTISLETREKLRNANLGKHHSEETKRKLKEISKRCLENPEFRKKLSESVKRSWAIRKQKSYSMEVEK